MVRNSKRAAKPSRKTLRLHSTFVAPGDSSSSSIAAYIEFQEILIEARASQLKRRLREFRERQRSSERQAVLMTKVAKVLKRHFADKISAKEAVEKIRRICPDKQHLRGLVDFFSKPASTPSTTPDQLVAAKADITRRENRLRAWTQTSRQLDVLSERAQTGEPDAIETLVKIGTQVVFSLMLVERTYPDAVVTVAKSQMLWPVLASGKAGWEGNMRDRIQKLELGKNLEVLHTPFHCARGPDTNYPARQWAKAAVRTIEETRLRYLMLGEVRNEVEEIVLDGMVAFANSPDWSGSACRLALLSKATASEWGVVVRAMIREQVPNFHTRPEWENQRNTGRAGGRDTLGELQNAILDDIVSALRRIAPEPCRNSSAEIKQAKKERPQLQE